MSEAVVDNTDRQRFEMRIGGAVAFADYEIDGDRIVLTHTEVPEELGGRGVGSALARGVFDAIRASGRRAVPRCSFMAAFARRHPEYAALVAD